MHNVCGYLMTILDALDPDLDVMPSEFEPALESMRTLYDAEYPLAEVTALLCDPSGPDVPETTVKALRGHLTVLADVLGWSPPLREGPIDLKERDGVVSVQRRVRLPGEFAPHTFAASGETRPDAVAALHELCADACTRGALPWFCMVCNKCHRLNTACDLPF